MNSNLRKAALLAAGIVGAGSAVTAEEAKMNPVETALSATTISGYVSASAMFDLGNNDGAPRLPGRVFDLPGEINRINLDVVKLTVEKGLSEGDWSAGYKLDLLFGPDANTLGVNSVFGNASTSDFGIKQAYVNLQAPVGNGLTAKIGVFDTIIGYEVFEHPNNPNYSRSYAYFIEPFQHTGLLLSYTVNEWLSFNAGIADAWNSRINAPGGRVPAPGGKAEEFGIQTYMGSMVITAGEGAGALKGASLYAGVVHGLSGTAGVGVDGGVDAGSRTSLYGGLSLPLGIEGLGLGLAYDYRWSESTPGADDYATTAAAYLSYQISKQLKASVRGEWARGTAGTWDGSKAFGIGRDEFFGLTGTLDILAWQNALVRLEARWDHDLAGAGSHAFGNAASPDDSALIVGANVIYKF